MSGRIGTRWVVGLLLPLGLTACERKPARQQETPPAASAKAIEAAQSKGADDTGAVEFEPIDPRSIPTRGVPTGTEGRFTARPAVVASPCGFHLVVSEAERAWTVLLVGHQLAWSKESFPMLLELDGVTLDVGLIDAPAMGALGQLPADRLLQLTGQWESSWLSREAGSDKLPIKENARGEAHLEPHPNWRVWSTTLGDKGTSAGVATTHAIVATVALDQRVLVLRALLNGETLALRALRRLVFAVDSIETRAGTLRRGDFTETLKKGVEEDPTCAAVHGPHDAQLE
jgi:hypothetical protein